jgi:hypothetical protein
MAHREMIRDVLVLAAGGLIFGVVLAVLAVRPAVRPATAQSASSNIVRWTDNIRGIGADLPERVATSEIIAEVRVESVEASQFNTATGAPPLATPSGEMDDIAMIAGWYVRQLVVLDVEEMYKGDPNLTKLVTNVFGGEYYAGNTDTIYRHEVLGFDLTELQVGDQAMIFGRETLVRDPATAPQPWIGRSLELRDSLAGGGETVVYMGYESAHLYNLTAGTATSVVDGATMSIHDLRQQVDALSP